MTRISPFRWRLEWALLVAAAASLVLTEQAREARERDPYQLVRSGRTAQALVVAAREQVVSLGTRRGVQQQEINTLVDLEWDDHSGARRRVNDLRLDAQTVAALGIDLPAGRWPRQVELLYLEHTGPRPVRPPATVSTFVTPLRAAPAQPCRPWVHCRLVILPPDVLSSDEEAARNVDYVLERAPYAFQLSVVLLVVLLGLRLAGLVHNRPSLE